VGKLRFFHEGKAFSEKNKCLQLQAIKNSIVQQNALLRTRLHSEMMLIFCEAIIAGPNR